MIKPIITICIIYLSILFSAENFTTLELQAVLIKNKTLGNRSREESCGIAYNQLHLRIGEIDDGAPGRLEALPAERRDKICCIASSLLNFAGWSKHAKALINLHGRNYNDYLQLIELIRPYQPESAQTRNLDISKARFLRLNLESIMEMTRQTYNEADPAFAIRREAYRLLDSSNTSAKVRLLEKADLIVTCRYFPTGNEHDGFVSAGEFMNEYYNARFTGRGHHNAVRNLRPAHEAVHNSVNAPTVPYMTNRNDQSTFVRQRARNIWQVIRQALAVLGNDEDSNADHGSVNDQSSSDGDDDEGGANARPNIRGNHDVFDNAPDDGNLENQNDGYNASQADNASEETDAHMAAPILPAERTIVEDSSDQESDQEVVITKKRKINTIILSDSEEDEISLNTLAFNSEDTGSKSNKKGRKIDPKTKEKNARILKALEENPTLSAPKIAANAGNDVTAGNVYHYIQNYAPQYKRKPEMSHGVIQEKNERVRLAHQQYPGKSHAFLAEEAGVSKDFVNGWFLKNGLTKPKTTPEQKKQNDQIIANLFTKHPEANATQIAAFAGNEGHKYITTTMVHKYVESRPDLKKPKPKTAPLTQEQKDRIVVLRDGGREFNDIVKEVGCTFRQAYKHYNKNKK